MTEENLNTRKVPRNLRINLTSIPPDQAGVPLTRKRSEGPFPRVPNTAILSICKHMERNGYSKNNYDYYDFEMLYPSNEGVREYFKKYQPHLVGLSVPISTGYSHVKIISKIIREECPDALIVMGGYLAGSSDAVIKCSDVDMTVVGDGEIAWLKICDLMTEEQLAVGARNIIDEDKLKEIRGIYFYDKSGKVHHQGFGESILKDDIPFPDYEFYERGLQNNPKMIKNYFRDYSVLGSEVFMFDPRASDPNKKKKQLASLFTSKGCVAACTFCQREAGGYRVFDVDKLDEHLELLKNKYDVGFIKVLDENWGQDRKNAVEVSKIMKKHNMLFFAVGRCTSFTYEDIKFYKECGMTGLQFGVESGSQRILDMMEKRYKVQQIVDVLVHCAKLQVHSPIPIILGMPGETEETVRETGQFVGKVAARVGCHPDVLGVSPLYVLPLPGTPLYEYGKQVGVFGKKAKEVDEFLDAVSGSNIYKRYYFNLNGAPQSEVIFWEWLLRLEASRAFREESKKVDAVAPETTRKIFIKMHDEEVKNNPHYSLKYKHVKFQPITKFIEKFIVGNKVIDKLPRWTIYPLVKWFGYLEYLVQCSYSSNRIHPIYQKRVKVERLSLDDLKNGMAAYTSSRSVRGKSLRGVVEGKKHMAFL